MELIQIVVALVLTGIVFGGFTSFVANEKNHNGVVWFWLGFFFQLIALIAIVGVPARPRRTKNIGERKKEGSQLESCIAIDGMECEVCTHFEATGVFDRYKEFCHFHEETTYKNHSCKHFTLTVNGRTYTDRSSATKYYKMSNQLVYFLKSMRFPTFKVHCSSSGSRLGAKHDRINIRVTPIWLGDRPKSNL